MFTITLSMGLQCPASIVECNDRFMLVASLHPHYRSMARFDGRGEVWGLFDACSGGGFADVAVHVVAAGLEVVVDANYRNLRTLAFPPDRIVPLQLSLPS